MLAQALDEINGQKKCVNLAMNTTANLMVGEQNQTKNNKNELY